MNFICEIPKETSAKMEVATVCPCCLLSSQLCCVPTCEYYLHFAALAGRSTRRPLQSHTGRHLLHEVGE